MHNDHKIKSLHLMLPKIHLKGYDWQTKWMYFLIEDNDLLEKYSTIWDKFIADVKQEFNREPVYNKKKIKN